MNIKSITQLQSARKRLTEIEVAISQRLQMAEDDHDESVDEMSVDQLIEIAFQFVKDME